MTGTEFKQVWLYVDSRHLHYVKFPTDCEPNFLRKQTARPKSNRNPLHINNFGQMDWHSERPFMAFTSNRRRSKQMVPIVWRKSPVVGRFYPVPYSRYVPDSFIIFFFFFFFSPIFFFISVGLTRPVDVDALDRTWGLVHVSSQPFISHAFHERDSTE